MVVAFVVVVVVVGALSSADELLETTLTRGSMRSRMISTSSSSLRNAVRAARRDSRKGVSPSKRCGCLCGRGERQRGDVGGEKQEEMEDDQAKDAEEADADDESDRMDEEKIDTHPAATPIKAHLLTLVS